MLSVSVVTSSIGRPSLARTIHAIKGQTYKGPLKHYVFINGPEYHAAGRSILDEHPDVHVCYLPEPATVGDVPGPESVYAAAPFLVKADVLFICNDDDVYEPEHVESLVTLIEKHDLAWAYSLRKAVDMEGRFIAEDDCESLGHWPCIYDDKSFLVDCSSYAIRRDLYVRVSWAWYQSPVGDRSFLKALNISRAPYGCSGHSTVRYCLQPHGGVDAAFFENNNKLTKQAYPDGYPWRKSTVFKARS